MTTETAPLLERIANGRTDLVFDYLAAGNPATAADANGVSLMQHCAYYGDVSAIRHLLANGASLGALGDDLGLNGACFHGHWRLAQFLLEQGADPNRATKDGMETGGFMRDVRTCGETPLHRAAAFGDAEAIKLLLDAGAKLDAKDAHGDTKLGKLAPAPRRHPAPAPIWQLPHSSTAQQHARISAGRARLVSVTQ
jgi:uncharacterized protein